jgi:ABC-type nitrate/sulfonate/bicarbonate transport system substrate-binding protein
VEGRQRDGEEVIALFALLLAAPEPQHLSLAVPGIPPVFSGLFAIVAREEGFFRKQGLDVEVRPFDSGAAAAQAVVAGGVDLSLSPTPVIVRMISNAGVDLVGIYGQEHPDWLLASADPELRKCAQLQDQAVGVDTVGGARAVALAQFLKPCGLDITQLKLVSLSSNVGAAMVAGQIKAGVLHTDDVPVLEEQMGRPLTVIDSFRQASPLSHYNLLVVKRESLAQKRDAYVRVIAALIDATRFMNDPKNIDRVAQIATATGRTAKVARQSLPHFFQIGFWPVGTDGMAQANVEAAIAGEKDAIKPGKTAVPYDRLVDRSLWKDAAPPAK